MKKLILAVTLAVFASSAAMAAPGPNKGHPQNNHRPQISYQQPKKQMPRQQVRHQPPKKVTHYRQPVRQVVHHHAPQRTVVVKQHNHTGDILAAGLILGTIGALVLASN